MADLLRFGVIQESDLKSDLSTVLLDDIFVMGTVDREDLLNANVLEQAALDPYVTTDAQGKEVVTVANLISHSLASLSDLVHYGLLTSLDFDLATVTMPVSLLAPALVLQSKLEDNNLVTAGEVNVRDVIRLGLVTLEEVAGLSSPAALHLTRTSLYVSDVLKSDVVGINVLHAEGLGASGPVDLEGLLESGLATQDDLVAAGLVDPDSFWDDSVVTLRALLDEGLVSPANLTPDATVPLAELLESNVVGHQYIQDHNLNSVNRDYVLIETLLADSHITFAELVRRGVLRSERFLNKVFEQSDLEAIMVLNAEGETVPLFEDGELDSLVHVGTVPLTTLLTSILYDVTLAEYVEEEFVDIHDFTDVPLTVADIEAEFGIDINDAVGPTIPLYSLVALDIPNATLVDLIEEGFVDKDDLTDPAMPLDIRDLEASDLFENGDLNNYISAHQVYLRGLISIVFLGKLVDLDLLGVSDLIVRNLGLLGDLVDDGLLNRDSFVNKSLSATSLNASGLVTTATLNLHHLVRGTSVSLYALVNSGLVSLAALIEAGLVGTGDLAIGVKGVEIEDIDRTDILDEAILEEHALIVGQEVRLNGSPSLLSTHAATLSDLVRTGVVDPSYLRADATIDKDGLVAHDLVSRSELIEAGLIAVSDVRPASALLDLEELDRTGALRLSSLDDLDEIVSLGLLTTEEADTYTPDLFGLTGHKVSLAGDYGLQLSGLISDVEAQLEASVAAQFDLLVDVDGAGSGPIWSVRDFELSATVSYDVTDLEVPARLGFVGVSLGHVDGTVHVTLTRTVTLDRDGDLGTTADRTFTLDEMLADTFDDVVSVTLTGAATATLHGVTVNPGLGGLGSSDAAEFLFEVEDLSRSKSDSDYVALEINNLPAAYDICEYLRLDDIMSAILRARNYVMQAFDRLPFWATDPNSPIYDLVSDVRIPIINKSPRELLGVVDKVDDAINRVQQILLDPANDVQKLIAFIKESLGLDAGSLTDLFQVSFEGTVVHLALKLEEDVNENFPFDFDLAALTGLVSDGVAGLEGIDSLIALGGGGNVNVRAYARVMIEAGIDVAPREGGLAVDKFLFDWNAGTQTGTRVDAGFKLLADDVALNFEIFDSIGLGTTGASATDRR